MKRFLSIFLSIALMLSGISAMAETDETPSLGYFSSLTDFRDHTQDFETDKEIRVNNVFSLGKDSITSYLNRATGTKNNMGVTGSQWYQEHAKDSWHVPTQKTGTYLFEPKENNKYYLHMQVAGQGTNPSFGPQYKITGMQVGETVHLSFMIKNNDFIYEKNISYIKNDGANAALKLVQMGKDGKMNFGFGATSPNTVVSVDYSLNRWYKIDIVFSNNADTDTVDYYLDGKKITTHSYSDITSSDLQYLAFIINSYSEGGSYNSSMGIDNIYGKFRSAQAGYPDITPRKIAYSDFEELHTSAYAADGLSATLSNGVVDYVKSDGVFGKESTDTSIMLTDASNLDSHLEDNPSFNAYEFDVGRIKEAAAFSSGEELKLSFSYAYNKQAEPGFGADIIRLGDSLNNLLSIDREGRVASSDGSGSARLTSGKWYNFDILLKSNGTDFDFKIYINGAKKIEGVADGNDLAKIIFCSQMSKGTRSESYLDDIYAEYFTGKGDDVAKPNQGLSHVDLEFSDDGKVFVPAGWNVEKLLAEVNKTPGTEATVKVLRDNDITDSGTCEDAVAIVGDLCPVYAYTYVKIKLSDPVAVLSDGNIKITTDVVNNSEDVNITLVAVVTSDGQVSKVISDSQVCSDGKTDFELNISASDGDMAKIYTLKGWDSKLPIFDDQIYSLDFDTLAADVPKTLESSKVPSPLTVSSDGIFPTDFTYDSDANDNNDIISVEIKGKIADATKTAAIYVVESGEDISTLSDGKTPIFTDLIITDNTGAFTINFELPKNSHGTYDVYLYSDSMDSLKTDFTYYTYAQRLAVKQNAIFEAVKASKTWEAMRNAILGTDDDGNLINDNFDIIAPSETDYQKVDNEAFFMALYGAKANITEFSKIKSEFERVAKLLNTPKGSEEEEIVIPGSNSSSSFGGGGSSRPSITTDPAVQPDINLGASAQGFSDMQGHWAQSYVDAMRKKGIINGYEDGNYRPENSVTRAELVKIITGAFGISRIAGNGFWDVPADAWHAPYIYAAFASGIANGYDGAFRPDEAVTRQDAAVMIYRAVSRTHTLGIGYIFFADETDIAAYAAEQISALAQVGIVTGSDNYFKPLDSLTRAEAAALISRAADYILAH